MKSGLLIIDKPRDWTSHDVVAKLRGILRERRIGHGGTLDPMATGVLVVFVGRATRAVQYLPGEKTYLAKIRTGITTDTLDITGEVLSSGGSEPSREDFTAALTRFTGDIEQIPPMVSAIKKDGQPLYKLARKGIEVERAGRRVNISKIEYLGREDSDFLIRVSCSAGTYIRTLADDIGREIGCGACLSGLRRERSGPFELRDAMPLESASLDALIPVERLFAEYAEYRATAREESALRNGVAVPAGGCPDGALLRVCAETGEFLLLGAVTGGKIHVEKSFYEVEK